MAGGRHCVGLGEKRRKYSNTILYWNQFSPNIKCLLEDLICLTRQGVHNHYFTPSAKVWALWPVEQWKVSTALVCDVLVVFQQDDTGYICTEFSGHLSQNILIVEKKAFLAKTI